MVSSPNIKRDIPDSEACGLAPFIVVEKPIASGENAGHLAFSTRNMLPFLSEHIVVKLKKHFGWMPTWMCDAGYLSNC